MRFYGACDDRRVPGRYPSEMQEDRGPWSFNLHHWSAVWGDSGVTDTQFHTDPSVPRTAAGCAPPASYGPSPGAPAVNAYRKAGQSKRRKKRVEGGVALHKFLLFYPLYCLMAPPSWGLGSVMRGIRHYSSRFAIARLFFGG